MSRIHLHQPTSILLLDQTLTQIISIIEQHVPGRVSGYYLVGSYAAGEALPASDVDLVIVFKKSLVADEQQQFLTAREHCKQVSPYTLDLSADNEAKLFRVGGVWFQTASRFLYGTDIRPLIPRKPVQAHIRDLMHSVYSLLARVRGNPPRLTVPLEYPDPTGSLYGYDQRHIRDGDHMRSVGTKDLVNNTLAIANTLTLRVAGQYVGSGKKADIPVQYQCWINDQWTSLVAEMYHTCRNSWGYMIPPEPDAQAYLRSLCHDVLEFENHFLCSYRDYLLKEVQQTDTAIVRFALQRLEQTQSD